MQNQWQEAKTLQQPVLNYLLKYQPSLFHFAPAMAKDGDEDGDEQEDEQEGRGARKAKCQMSHITRTCLPEVKLFKFILSLQLQEDGKFVDQIMGPLVCPCMAT